MNKKNTFFLLEVVGGKKTVMYNGDNFKEQIFADSWAEISIELNSRGIDTGRFNKVPLKILYKNKSGTMFKATF